MRGAKWVVKPKFRGIEIILAAPAIDVTHFSRTLYVSFEELEECARGTGILISGGRWDFRQHWEVGL